MKLVFMGTPDFAAECLRSLIENKMDVAAVFTKEDRPVGRGHRMAASPVKELAQANAIPLYQPHRVKDD